MPGKKRNSKDKICVVCREQTVRTQGKHPDGEPRYDKICLTCHGKLYSNTSGRYKYRKAKGKVCERCGFVGESCQLDVDHKDGNHRNNEPSNLQTLCATCHRLKTVEDRKRNACSRHFRRTKQQDA